MNQKPRIAMILPDRIEHPVGGMGVQAKYLIKHLQKDFDFTVHGFPDETSLPYYHQVFNPLPKIGHGGVAALTCQASYLASILKLKEKPDLIHVTDYTEFLGGFYAARILGVPLVVSMQLSAHLMNEAGIFQSHNPQSPDGLAIENAFREMELFGLTEADHIIHVSNLYKKIFSAIPGLDEKSTHIPNGVDLQEWRTDTEKFQKITLPGSNKLKVVYLGRFAQQKNILALLTAQIPRDIDLIYVGAKESGPTEIFNEIIRKTQTERNIFYLGPVYDQEKVNLLHAADAVIIPSAHECHPIIMHEALASESVVLSSGAGDMSEILPSHIAINCGVAPDSITQALEILARMSDKEIAERKKLGLQIVQNYTWASAAEKTKKVYQKVLKH